MFEAIKSTILWNFGRTTWQYDILCLLILAFIFFTPKEWFEGRARSLPKEEVSVNRAIPETEVFLPDNDRDAPENRVRKLTRNAAAKIIGWQPKMNTEGNVIAYDVKTR